MNKKGFTLVELIVVIAIIIILAILGFTAYVGYIQRAQNNTKISLLAEGSRAVERESITTRIPRCDYIIPDAEINICWFCKQNTPDCTAGINTTDWTNAQLINNPRDFNTNYFFVYIHTDKEFQIIGTDKNNKAIIRGNTNQVLFSLPDLEDENIADDFKNDLPQNANACKNNPQNKPKCQDSETQLEPDEVVVMFIEIINELGGPGDIRDGGDSVPYTLVPHESNDFFSILDLVIEGE